MQYRSFPIHQYSRKWKGYFHMDFGIGFRIIGASLVLINVCVLCWIFSEPRHIFEVVKGLLIFGVLLFISTYFLSGIFPPKKSIRFDTLPVGAIFELCLERKKWFRITVPIYQKTESRGRRNAKTYSVSGATTTSILYLSITDDEPVIPLAP